MQKDPRATRRFVKYSKGPLFPVVGTFNIIISNTTKDITASSHTILFSSNTNTLIPAQKGERTVLQH